MGVREGIDPLKLDETGWGVIFPTSNASGTGRQREAQTLREALQPLLEHRKAQAGSRYREYAGTDGLRPGETKSTFLARHGMGPGPADPDKAPYYLLLVGDPQAIPYRFQRELAVQYAVGRIHFDTLDEYAAYARSVVMAESGRVKLARNAAFFGAANPDDPVTKRCIDQLVEPLARTLKGGDRWDIQTILAAAATKARLASLLGGSETPALLFASGHGMGFPQDDPRQAPHQGALLCQDWSGPRQWRGPIPQDFYFAGEDVQDGAGLLGSIAFLHASFSAGTAAGDQASPRVQPQPDARPVDAAGNDALARLPQRLLGHPRGGMLAVVGWVDRLWGSSFDWEGAKQEAIVYEAGIKRLLNGYPIGSALEYFDQRYAGLSTELNTRLEDSKFGEIVPPEGLAELWTANNDMRSVVIIGDPAVRLPVVEEGGSYERPVITPVEPTKTTSPAPGLPSAAESAWTRIIGAVRDSQTRVSVALRRFAEKLAEVVSEPSGIQVRSYFSKRIPEIESVRAGFPDKEARPFAETHIELDGDRSVMMPIAKDGSVDEGLAKAHQELVARFAVHRATLFELMTSIVKTLEVEVTGASSQPEPAAGDGPGTSIFSPGVVPHELLAAWHALSASTAEDSRATETQRSESLRWQADLPADSQGASEAVARAQARLDAFGTALDAAEARLKAFASPSRALDRDQAGAVVSAAGMDPGRSTMPENATGGIAGIDLTQAERDWPDAMEQYHSYLIALTQCVEYPVWAETRVRGEIQAQTAITWSGNMDTVYLEPLGAERAAQHSQTLDLALTSTQLLLRKLEIICRGAALLTESASLSALPGGKILALPAAWRFVDSVLEEGKGPE